MSAVTTSTETVSPWTMGRNVSVSSPFPMQDGVLYSNILLKLYLKSLKHGGWLQLDEDIPYTAQMISTITRQQIGTVERREPCRFF